MKFSELVPLAKKIAGTDHCRIPLAAWKALKQKGLNPDQTLRITRGIGMDVNFEDERMTLLQALTSTLGKEGGQQAAINKETRRQMSLSIGV